MFSCSFSEPPGLAVSSPSKGPASSSAPRTSCSSVWGDTSPRSWGAS